MSCRITGEWAINGIKTVILENKLIKLTFLVDFGCRIHEIISKTTDKDFLWHNPRVEVRRPVFGANIDDWLTGGLDEAIPTGHPCKVNGEELPYLGELWSLRWDYSIIKDTSDEVEVYFSRKTIIFPLKVEKWVSLKKGQKIINFKHRISNLSNKKIPFLWGIHPCFSVNENTRIDIPARTVLIEESIPDDWLGKKGDKYIWPYAKDKNGNKIDMREVRSFGSNTCEFQFATDLEEGWLALTDQKMNEGIGLVFPKDIFSVIWLWLSYGGWRSQYLAAVEAWTGYPAKLSEAIEIGRFSELKANEVINCNTKIIIFNKKGEVREIKNDGTVL